VKIVYGHVREVRVIEAGLEYAFLCGSRDFIELRDFVHENPGL